MVYAVRVPIREAERIRLWLKEHGYYCNSFRPKSLGDNVLFPVNDIFLRNNNLNLNVVKVKMQKVDAVQQPRLAFDLIGDICIFKRGFRGIKYKNEIRKLKKLYKFIKTFYVKIGRLDGIERVPTLKFLSGIKKEITLHSENGLKFYVNVKKTYFNPRLATERRRICGLVSPSEEVLDLFAGVGPFSITLAKFRKVSVDAVDINPYAVSLLIKNIRINNVDNLVYPHLADAANFSSEKKYDRIIMNLPFGSLMYLRRAAQLCKEKSIIHIYLAQKAEKKDYSEEILETLRGAGRVDHIMKTEVFEYAPRLSVERYDIQFT
jgi:tRNA (guanine37-N1)-methyltransferase